MERGCSPSLAASGPSPARGTIRAAGLVAEALTSSLRSGGSLPSGGVAHRPDHLVVVAIRVGMGQVRRVEALLEDDLRDHPELDARVLDTSEPVDVDGDLVARVEAADPIEDL